MIATIAEMHSGRFVRFIVSSATKIQLAILQLSLCFQDSLIQLPNSGTMRSLTRLEVPGQPGLGQMGPDRKGGASYPNDPNDRRDLPQLGAGAVGRVT